jgi:hypothetical protein
MVEEGWRKAKDTPARKCAKEPVYHSFALGRIRPKAKFQQDNGRDEPNDRAVPANHPLRMQSGSKKINQDIGVEQDLPAYR